MKMTIRCGVGSKGPVTRECHVSACLNSSDAAGVYSSDDLEGYEDFEDYDDFEDDDDDILSVDGFYRMFVPNLDTNIMAKAARILYNWYEEEGEEYMPDFSDVLDMCDAADDEDDKNLVLFALGELSEDELE